MNGAIYNSVGTAGLALLLALAGYRAGTVAAAEPPRLSATSNALPDWGSSWGTRLEGRMHAAAALQKALKPQGLATFQETFRKLLANQEDLRRVLCETPTFAGFSGGFDGSIEFLFTPGRVTLIAEEGLVRRLYTDGRALPAEPEPSDAGTSIAHWEGQTLVVETTGLRPDALAFSLGAAVGEHARVIERIFLKDADVLQIDVTLDAPQALSHPAKTTYLYRRQRGYTMTSLTGCHREDRSVDPVTGHQRFDMTPPADLPPPPSE